MVPHVQLSTNCGVGCLKNKNKIFSAQTATFLVD
jgi:hypothetical protein